MKITKSQLKRIIQEELESVLNEMPLLRFQKTSDPEKPEMQQLTPHGWAKREYSQEDPDSDADDAAELRSGLDLDGFEIKKIRTGYLIVDKESGSDVLGPFQFEDEAMEALGSIERNPDYRPGYRSFPMAKEEN
jgi:hypothetical protein